MRKVFATATYTQHVSIFADISAGLCKKEERFESLCENYETMRRTCEIWQGKSIKLTARFNRLKGNLS